MHAKNKKTIIGTISKTIITTFLLLSVSLLLTSCTASKKQKAAQSLSDILRSNYICNLSYTIRGSENEYTGKANITKNGYITRLDILSPDPYSGLGIEYNVSGLPESAAIHFLGMNTSLPIDSMASINPLASLFADDFASVLSKIPNDSITEYELEDKTAFCATLTYSDADITICFSDDGSIPYSLEYSKDISAEITFDYFKPEIQNLSE